MDQSSVSVRSHITIVEERTSGTLHQRHQAMKLQARQGAGACPKNKAVNSLKGFRLKSFQTLRLSPGT
jgi:hypothetical protein